MQRFLYFNITSYRFLQFLPEVVVLLLELSGVGNSLRTHPTTHTGLIRTYSDPHHIITG